MFGDSAFLWGYPCRPDWPSVFASRGRPFSGGGHRGGPRRRGRQRIQRGDIKYLLLALLAEHPQHGYQLIKELENRWGGLYRPSPGSVYPTLQLLEEGGYLSSEPVEGKKVYSITESGRELLAENQEALQAMDMPEEAPQIMELRNAVRDLHEVVHQVARSGDENRMQRVLGSLKKIRREIYLILAEEE